MRRKKVLQRIHESQYDILGKFMRTAVFCAALYFMVPFQAQAAVMPEAAGSAEAAEATGSAETAEAAGMPGSTEPAETEIAWNVLPAVGSETLMDKNRSREEYIAMAKEAQNAFWGYTNLGIADVEGNLNIRENPSLEGKLVGKLPKDAACEILDIEEDWAHIQSGEVEGYVKMHAVDDPEDAYLLTGPEARIKAKELVRTVARVTSDGVRIREEAGLEGAVLTQVLAGEELEFLEDLGDWVKVSVDDEEAYVSAEYVEIEEKLSCAVSMSELAYGTGVSDVRVDLAEYAKQFLGNPYVWGGTSLTKGADCSGFVQSIFKHYGISLSRTARAQSKDGTKISYSDLLPGDLIFYANSKGTINHVTIYIGGGQVIHASSRKTGIKISKYNYRTPVKYVRVIKD